MITQGNWEATKPHRISSCMFKCIVQVSRSVLAFAYGNSKKEALDNARLIAAAPDLLDACKQAVCGNMGWKGKLKYAIEKAEGK